MTEKVDRLSGLPLRNGVDVLSASGPSSCVTVYVGVEQTAGLPPGSGVRLDLIANLAQRQRLIAGAFVPAGYVGPAFVVSGLQVDAWIVRARSNSGRVTFTGSIRASQGCAAFSLIVPPQLRVPFDLATPASGLLEPSPAPLEPEQGAPNHDTGSGNIIVSVPAGRVVRLVSALAGATAVDVDYGNGSPVLTIPAGTPWNDTPRLVGPTDVEFSGNPSFWFVGWYG